MSRSSIRITEAPPGTELAIHPPDGNRGVGLPGNFLGRVFQTLIAQSRQIAGRLKVPRNAKAMRLCETISLGDKRFLAIVQVDEERILIGGSASTVALLTRLPETKPFSAVLLERSNGMHSA